MVEANKWIKKTATTTTDNEPSSNTNTQTLFEAHVFSVSINVLTEEIKNY